MRTTIDKAGRVVIPARIREKAGLVPGTEIDVVLDDLELRLVPRVPGPKLVRRKGRWIAVPQTAGAHVDVAALIEEERDRWPR